MQYSIRQWQKQSVEQMRSLTWKQKKYQQPQNRVSHMNRLDPPQWFKNIMIMWQTRSIPKGEEFLCCNGCSAPADIWCSLRWLRRSCTWVVTRARWIDGVALTMCMTLFQESLNSTRSFLFLGCVIIQVSFSIVLLLLFVLPMRKTLFLWFLLLRSWRRKRHLLLDPRFFEKAHLANDCRGWTRNAVWCEYLWLLNNRLEVWLMWWKLCCVKSCCFQRFVGTRIWTFFD